MGKTFRPKQLVEKVRKHKQVFSRITNFFAIWKMKILICTVLVFLVLADAFSVAKKHHKKKAAQAEDPEGPAPAIAEPLPLTFGGVVPVEVDLTQLMSRINEHIQALDSKLDSSVSSLESSISSTRENLESSISALESTVSSNKESVDSSISSHESSISSVESRVSSLESSLNDMDSKLEGASYCEIGHVGCESGCGGSDPDNDRTQQTNTYPVTFKRPFPATPTVTIALNDIYMRAPGESDWYGWTLNARDITTSGFTAEHVLDDREISKFWGMWVACAPIA